MKKEREEVEPKEPDEDVEFGDEQNSNDYTRLHRIRDHHGS